MGVFQIASLDVLGKPGLPSLFASLLTYSIIVAVDIYGEGDCYVNDRPRSHALGVERADQERAEHDKELPPPRRERTRRDRAELGGAARSGPGSKFSAYSSEDEVLRIAMAFYFLQFVLIAALADPAEQRSIGIHQTLGPCAEVFMCEWWGRARM
jgi:hypothetical protein